VSVQPRLPETFASAVRESGDGVGPDPEQLGDDPGGEPLHLDQPQHVLPPFGERAVRIGRRGAIVGRLVQHIRRAAEAGRPDGRGGARRRTRQHVVLGELGEALLPAHATDDPVAHGHQEVRPEPPDRAEALTQRGEDRREALGDHILGIEAGREPAGIGQRRAVVATPELGECLRVARPHEVEELAVAHDGGVLRQ
jgi:hypothetical protein